MNSEPMNFSGENAELDRLVRKLQKYEGGIEFLSGRDPNCNWCEQNVMFHFTLVSDGRSGDEWFEDLFKRGVYDKPAGLRADLFVPTKGVKYKITVFRLFGNQDSVLEKARAGSNDRLGTEGHCLMRDTFSIRELEMMGLFDIALFFHDMEDIDPSPRYDQSHWLRVPRTGKPGSRWGRSMGKMFVQIDFPVAV